jgi:hypothetical protein
VDDSFGHLLGSCAHGKGELFDVFLILYFLFCLLWLDLFCILSYNLCPLFDKMYYDSVKLFLPSIVVYTFGGYK